MAERVIVEARADAARVVRQAQPMDFAVKRDLAGSNGMITIQPG
jgi:hypothetical protein